MVYGFYFRFYKITKCKYLSIILSKLAYFLYLIIFQIKRIRLPKRIISMSKTEADEIINSKYTKPEVSLEYRNLPIDESVDLSIIVPVYNYVNLVRNNIDSIINQKTTFKYELIIVDDGSTDGARDIVLEYDKLPNVKVILQNNQGIGGARNTGIENAVGRYLMFVDCDDTIHNDLVDTLMKKTLEDDYDIVMCGHNLSKEKDGQVYNVIPNIYPECNLLHYKNNDQIMNFAGLPWCKVYKREMWNDIRFFPGFWYEDTIIHFLLFTKCKKFAYVPKVCYEYRWYENNFSHTQTRSKNIKNADRFGLMSEIIKRYEELGMPIDGRFYTLLIKHFSNYYYNEISNLEDDMVQALFVEACEMLEKYKVEKCKLPYMLRVTEKAMLERNIELWKLSSCFQ